MSTAEASNEIRQPWERREGEGREPWEGFQGYLESRDSAGKRSVARAWRKAPGEQDGSKRAPSRWFEWSKEFGWPERAEAKDAWKRAEEEAAQAEERRAVARRLERRRLEQAEIELRDATALRGAAALALRNLMPHLIPRKKRRPATESERASLGLGPDEVIVEVHPARVSLPNVAQAFKLAGETERTALEMIVGKVEVAHTGQISHEVHAEINATVQVQLDLSALPDDLLIQLRATAQRLLEVQRALVPANGAPEPVAAPLRVTA